MKRILSILLLASLAMTTNAQIVLAVKGGLNVSNQLKPYVYTYNAEPWYDRGQSLLGINASVFTQFVMFNDVLLRFQLGYAGLGYKLPEARDGLGVLISPAKTFRLSYMALPLQIIYPVKLKFGTIYAGVGPYAAMVMGGHIESPSSTVPTRIGNSRQDHFIPLDFGISPTIGLKLKKGFLLGVDYNLGLKDVSAAAGKNRNVSWSFYIGYVFKNDN